MSTLIGLTIVGLLITIHELGHLLACKWRKVAAPVFSIGFGPTLAARKFHGTEYRLAAIPLGGYVQYEQEEDGIDIDPIDRIIIFFGGPLANFALAFVIYAGLGNPASFLHATGAMLDFLSNLFTGQLPLNKLSGPVGIIQFAGQSASQGGAALLSFAAFLSLNLAILNLLPLPVLDGGQILRAIVEWTTGRRVAMKWRIGMALAAWGLLLAVFFYVTAFDIWRLFQPGKIA